MKQNYFNFNHIKGDFFGGMTAGIVALPLALAFGVSSGLGPSAGLYGAIFVAFFASLFGGTQTQVSGPTAPMTAVSMVVVAGLVANFDGNISQAMPVILTVFLIAGLMQIGLGFIGLGRYIKYIPYPVVSGFMTAIGLIILVTQIMPFVGYYPEEDKEYVQQFQPLAQQTLLNKIMTEQVGEGWLDSDDLAQTLELAKHISAEQILHESQALASNQASTVIGAIKVLPRALSAINWVELTLAFATVFVVYGFRRITKKIPGELVALVLVSGVALVTGMDYRPIEEIPTGLPVLHWAIITDFNLPNVAHYLLAALSLALLGAIDSLLTSTVADNMTKTKHRPNKELLGQGIGNSIAAVFGGLPGAGATIRTVVNIRAGGKTRLSGMMAGIFLLTTLLILGPIASKIPVAVLAGLLITVGFGVMDYKGLKAIPYMPRAEVMIMLLVLVLSAAWNLVYAVGIGLVIASLMFMKKIGDLTMAQSDIKPLRDEKVWIDEVNFSEQIFDNVFIKHFKGPLFFGSTSDFQKLAKQIPDMASVIIMRMDKMSYIDQSGLYIIEEILIELVKTKKIILLVNLAEQPRYMMESIKIIPNLIPQAQIFDDFKECVKWVKNKKLLT